MLYEVITIIAITLISIPLTKAGFDVFNVRDFAKGGISGGFPSFHLPKVPFSLKTLEVIMGRYQENLDRNDSLKTYFRERNNFV